MVYLLSLRYIRVTINSIGLNSVTWHHQKTSSRLLFSNIVHDIIILFDFLWKLKDLRCEQLLVLLWYKGKLGDDSIFLILLVLPALLVWRTRRRQVIIVVVLIYIDYFVEPFALLLFAIFDEAKYYDKHQAEDDYEKTYHTNCYSERFIRHIVTLLIIFNQISL